LFVQFPVSRTPRKSATAVRRASLPLSTRGARQQSPSRPNFGILHCVKSPDVSVNSPRIDRIAEFPLASYEEPVFGIHKTSSTSVQGSSGSPQYNDHSITKDKCTVQTDRAAKPSFPETWQGIRRSMFKADVKEGSDECSDQNATAGASSHTSSDSCRRRFDPSSFQQRAEALEGMLEFSARLLQQERYEELGVLLKPFGPGKVSSRETAIWLTKSFKENTLKQED
jgi:NIMA (never in mitosis gene a)-related kinase